MKASIINEYRNGIDLLISEPDKGMYEGIDKEYHTKSIRKLKKRAKPWLYQRKNILLQETLQQS